jgi:hypothetical protein
MKRALLALLPALLALPSCNRTTEPDTSEAAPRSSGAPQAKRPAHPPPPHPPQPSLPSGPAEAAWDAPAAWPKVENASPMRKATYRVPRAAGDAEDGELTVTQAGGTVDQNLARWAQQLARKPQDAKRSERSAHGLKVTVVEIHGDYSGMAMPGAPAPEKKPGYALLGAIAETSPPTFFKLVGPEKTVVAVRADFDRFVESLRAK